jgi:hypothetical protein
MKTITLNRARYTVRDDRHSFLSDILKLTGKHKPVRPKGGERRLYPTDGAVSTADYVAQYYALNSGRWPKLQGSPYGLNNTLAGFYEGLSDRVTVPMGEDSMEVCDDILA